MLLSWCWEVAHSLVVARSMVKHVIRLLVRTRWKARYVHRHGTTWRAWVDDVLYDRSATSGQEYNRSQSQCFPIHCWCWNNRIVVNYMSIYRHWPHYYCQRLFYTDFQISKLILHWSPRLSISSTMYFGDQSSKIRWSGVRPEGNGSSPMIPSFRCSVRKGS